MGMIATFIMALGAVGTIVIILWLEQRPRSLGKPLLVPLTPLLFLAILALVIALAHMVSLYTGTPHVGRLG